MSAPVIIKGLQGDYYEVDGFKYTATFPYNWAIDHKWLDVDCGSGPKNCCNCRSNGSIHGVFVYYCLNCVTYIYNGVTADKRHAPYCCFVCNSDEELWKACPYMQGIHRSQIGHQVQEVTQDDHNDFEGAYKKNSKTAIKRISHLLAVLYKKIM